MIKHNLLIKENPNDWMIGHIQLKGNVADWLPHFLFDDRQLLPDGNDTDCCWDFSNNKIFDALMDVLMPTLPAEVLWPAQKKTKGIFCFGKMPFVFLFLMC